MTFLPKNADETSYTVLYNIEETNEMFTKAIESVITYMAYPIPMNLVDVLTDGYFVRSEKLTSTSSNTSKYGV